MWELSLKFCLGSIIETHHTCNYRCVGRDGAFIGHQENQYAVLEDDGMGLVLNFLEEEPDLMTGGSARPSFSVEGNGKENGLKKPNGVPVADAITFEKSDSDTEGEEEEAEQPPVSKPEGPKQRVALQFVFDSTVQRIFSSPLGMVVSKFGKIPLGAQMLMGRRKHLVLLSP